MPSVKSGCELFLRFITLAKFDTYAIDECRQKLIERGEVFLERTLSSRQRIAEYSQEFIVDGSIIFKHIHIHVLFLLYLLMHQNLHVFEYLLLNLNRIKVV